jgi:hypothetical protein
MMNYKQVIGWDCRYQLPCLACSLRISLTFFPGWPQTVILLSLPLKYLELQVQGIASAQEHNFKATDSRETAEQSI